MNNKDILKIAMIQSAIDSNCEENDFLSDNNKIVISKTNGKARNYLDLPFSCDFTSYGNNIVASVSAELHDIVEDFLSKYSFSSCFETPTVHVLVEKLQPHNLKPCFMAEYFLPDIEAIKPLSCEYETKTLTSIDFKELYLPEWSNALCVKRKESDVLAIGAFDNGNLIGLAGCSADCATMWQIGVDVLPEYRQQGVASCITSQLAVEVLAKGIVPFYCCAWSNLKSARNAIKSGFKPAWVQLTVKTTDFVNDINQAK